MLCAAFSVSYISKYKNAYEAFIGSSVALDLRTNHTAALSSDPYGDGGVLDKVPAISTPPVFAWLRSSIAILGTEDYETFESRYRLLWPILCPIILCVLVGCTIFRECATAEKSLRDTQRRKSNVCRDPGTYGMLAVVVLLVFVPAVFHDWIFGNTSIFVSFLFMVQIALSFRQSDVSRFLQGALIATAWWFKPNIVLVLIFLFVISLRRKEYAYITGMATAMLVIPTSSFLAPNIHLQTYMTFVFDISRTLETHAWGGSGNLSFARIEIFDSAWRYIQACFLLGSILLIGVFAGKGRNSLIQQEAACFLLTVIPWPIFWCHYLSWVALAMWFLIFQMSREGKHPYFMIILVVGLSWSSFIHKTPMAVNSILLVFLLLYWRTVFLDKNSEERPSYEQKA
jgi:hypothetical protein